MTPVPVQVAKLEWPERILACRLEVGGGGLCIVGCYVPPGSSNDWAKVEVLEALYDFVFGIRRGPLIIAGDFNTPREELADGRVVTWAQRLDASGEVRNLTYRKGEPSGRWDRAERSIVQGLPALGYRDVFRSRYRHATKAFSWNKRRKGREIRRRYDHIFASDELKTKSCEYLHSPRARSLSDHAPIRAVFSWMPDSGRDP
jgi:exonuclease III